MESLFEQGKDSNNGPDASRCSITDALGYALHIRCRVCGAKVHDDLRVPSRNETARNSPKTCEVTNSQVQFAYPVVRYRLFAGLTDFYSCGWPPQP